MGRIGMGLEVAEMATAEVQVIREAAMTTAAATTPGMDRRQAFADGEAWVGTVTTQAGVLTGWHVHPEYDTYVYVLSGNVVVESGPGGRRSDTAGPRDFVRIPRGLVHREGTAAGSNGVEAVIVRVGHGELVVNRDGPEPG
jgi:uncharacterized RmlC-like cupin family protein